MLHPFVARNDTQRRVTLNTIGPVWEGNQVWFILGGGAVFAAWPPLYAVSFSGFYLAMLLVLIGFILRPVAHRLSRQEGDARLARDLGLAVLRLGLCPCADLRRRLRQSSAGRSLPFRSDAARDL